MALETKERIVTIHTDAIVGDLEEGDAAPAGEDFDAGGLCINGVFNEFFDNSGRPLDHLACGDLAGDFLRQQLDSGHGMESVGIADAMSKRPMENPGSAFFGRCLGA
jgi:hypothetical protein